MRVRGSNIEVIVGGSRFPVLSFSYGETKPAAPERVLVSGRYDFEQVLIERPQPVIRDALSDRVESIVERFVGT